MLTNTGLVEHAKKALNEKWGYVWGTFGNVLTQKLLNEKLAQYPDGVGRYEDFIRIHWLNRRTADCVGLIKSYLWWDGSNPRYVPATDVSADGMYERAKEKGLLSSMPNIPGICLWHKGHIGVYIGGGQVIEAHGTKFGVIQTPLKGGTAWTHWLKCPYIEYVTDMTVQDAINILHAKGVIKTPDYWEQNAVSGGIVKGEYAAQLIINFAKKL